MGIETYITAIVILLTSFILVLIDAITKVIRANKEYKKTSFSMVTNYSFIKTVFNKKISDECSLFETLEKTCMTGHLLADVNVKNSKDEIAHFDIVMIDKYGISVFDIVSDTGTISGNSTMPFWRCKKIFNHKIPNYYMVLSKKLEILSDVLKISDSGILNGYLIFDKNVKFKNMKLDNKKIKLVKKAFAAGAISYEVSNTQRVISDNEIMAYTIMLEKFTHMPLYLRDEKLVLKEDNLLENDRSNDKSYTFEFKNKITSYEELKRIWSILCKCDKDNYPPYSLQRKDLETIPVYARELLIPNVFYKHIINYPMIVVRRNGLIVGFLAFEPHKVLKISEELGRVNLIDCCCVLREYRRDGLVEDLYRYMETRLPLEVSHKYIITKSSSRNEVTNNMLKNNGYKEKVIVDTKKQYGATTIYYFKKVK